MSKTELLSCAGVPVRSEKVGEMEFMTYISGGDSIGVASGSAGYPSSCSVVPLKRRYCEVTFVLRIRVVEKVNYTELTGGFATKGEQCGLVVENCLSPKQVV
ncbi:MAG: hypothetical protein HYW01_06320 [Deltaproteobacteria bacterium]|nr:hypothetical protein [Deltaproteobacteria bacterium]